MRLKLSEQCGLLKQPIQHIFVWPAEDLDFLRGCGKSFHLFGGPLLFLFWGLWLGRSGCLRTGSTPHSTSCVDTACSGYLMCALWALSLAVVCGVGLFGFGWSVVGLWQLFVSSSPRAPSPIVVGRSASSVSHGGWSPRCWKYKQQQLLVPFTKDPKYATN